MKARSDGTRRWKVGTEPSPPPLTEWPLELEVAGDEEEVDRSIE